MLIALYRYYIHLFCGYIILRGISSCTIVLYGVRRLTIIEIIGENIRCFRQQKGLSQEQLALHSGMNTSYIGQIERGEKNPTVRTLEKIAIALDTTIIELFSSPDSLKNGDSRSQSQQFLAILTPEDIRRYMLGILKDETNKPRS